MVCWGCPGKRARWAPPRPWGDARDSFDQSVYAHTRPTYFRGGARSESCTDAARFFLDSIDESLKWIDTVGRYNNDEQREDVRELFRRGREIYAGLTG